MKKFMPVAILVLLTVSFLLFATEQAESSSKEAEKAEQLKALLIGNPDQVKWWEHILPMFEKESGLDVEFNALPFTDLYSKQGVFAASNDSTYDVYSSHFAKIASFRDYYMPLDDYLDEAYLSDFLDSALLPLKGENGEIVALPLWMDARVLYYNKKHYSKFVHVIPLLYIYRLTYFRISKSIQTS